MILLVTTLKIWRIRNNFWCRSITGTTSPCGEEPLNDERISYQTRVTWLDEVNQIPNVELSAVEVVTTVNRVIQHYDAKCWNYYFTRPRLIITTEFHNIVIFNCDMTIRKLLPPSTLTMSQEIKIKMRENIWGTRKFQESKIDTY